MTPTSWLLVIAGLGLGVVYAARAVAVAVHRRRRSAAHPSRSLPAEFWEGEPDWVLHTDGSFHLLNTSDPTWHTDPDGFVVEDAGLSGWDGSKGP